MAITAPAAAQTVVGDWHGTLDAGGTKLPLAVHIQQGPDGEPTGTLDSPNQGANGLPIAAISKDPGVLAFTVPVVGGSYAGRWDAETGRWKGQWRQGGAALPLELEPGLLPSSAVSAPPALPVNWTIPADDEIARLIAERDAQRPGQGMVVGVLESGKTRIVAEGPAGAASFDGTSLFEIGSISKVFTAILLADMANKGEVALDDPAVTYLPAGHRMPERGGRQITLKDLSQHVSGLPRLPDNMPYGDPDDPYADYTEAQLLAFLDRYELTRDIGSQSEYSNFGVGLLGYLLGRAAGKDYETLLAERVTGPLGMHDTSVTLQPAQRARLVQGYDTFMRPAKPWNLPMLMGAGGIRSTADDMLTFAAAVIDPNSPIAAAVATAVANRATSSPAQALGWQIMRPAPDREALFHNGGTGGYRSALLVEPGRKTAVVVLMNSAVEPSATDFAVHLLIGAPLTPLQPVPSAPAPRVTRAEVELPVTELDRVVGNYDFGDGILHITREGTVMRSARAGVPTLQIYPEAPLQFFFKAIDAQLRFTADETGRVTGVTFTQPGLIEASGKRIES
jgi:CubicO group peptidase (beta-lactamase class C family)